MNLRTINVKLISIDQLKSRSIKAIEVLQDVLK